MRRALPRRLRPAAVVACLSLLPLFASGLVAAEGQTAAASASPGTLTIEHTPPGCLPAGKPARLAACFRPEGVLARARVYFRAGGTRDWFYVEMSGPPPCLQGTLPRPKKSVKQVEYYLAATDRSSAESRTADLAVPVSPDGQCSAGPMAPVASSGSSVIGSASGAAPAGFGGAGLSPLLIAGGVAVIGGGAAVAVAGGGGGEQGTTTTTLPPTTTTTTTTTTSTTTTTTTTTTTLKPKPPVCETQPPTVTLTAPTDDQLGGTQATLAAEASDPSPSSGIKDVRFYWKYCPSGVCQGEQSLGSDTTAPYEVVWTFPSCGSMPEDRYAIFAVAEDKCGNKSGVAKKDVRLIGRGCDVRPAAVGAAARAASWVSELSVDGGRGQVVVDGSDAVFPASGVETFTAAAGPGAHRFEATLVDASGRPGSWRFDLTALGAAAGSLRVVAGEAAVVGPAAVVFRLKGKPGERVVFSVEVGRGE